MTDLVTYVYGIVAEDATAAASPPPGLEGAPVIGLAGGALRALVSRLDANDYAAAALEERVGDVDWLAPRARAHDLVVTWASDRGAVVPLPMFSLFRDDAGVRQMLRTRGEELQATLTRVREGREYGVRLFRPRELPDTLLAAHSPRIAALAAQARASSPGQRFLIERKLAAERAAEERRVATTVARETFASLRTHALDGRRRPLPPREGDGLPAVLDASFLVAPGAFDDFRAELTAIASRHAPDGFHVEFTGPWPPYHFVTPPDDA